MEILKNIYHIQMGFINVYLLVDEDGLILVDSGAFFSHRKIISFMQELDFQPGDIKAVLITHADFDHVGAIPTLRKLAGFEVFASQVAADALAIGRSSRELKIGPIGRSIANTFEKYALPRVKVERIVNEGDLLTFMGGIEVVSTPGHTPGHLSYYLADQKILFCGDSMRSNDAGLTSGCIRPITWDEDMVYVSIRKQSKLGAEIVGVGHGPVTTNVSEESFPIGDFW